MHSHLILNIDDGSKSREMKVNMLRQAVEGETSKLVLTPHYFPGYYEVPINEVREKAKEVSLLAKAMESILKFIMVKRFILTKKYQNILKITL